jgi:hypothetical protein
LLLISTFFAGCLSANAQKNQGDPRDEAAIHDYVLTMPRVQAYAAAVKAAQTEGLNEKSMAAECSNLDDDKMSLVDKVQYVENSCPKLNTWIKAHGLTANDFMVIPMSLITAGFAQVAIDAGGKPPAFINPANVEFVKQHKDELQKLDIIGDQSNRKSNKSGDSKDDDNNP